MLLQLWLPSCCPTILEFMVTRCELTKLQKDRVENCNMYWVQIHLRIPGIVGPFASSCSRIPKFFKHSAHSRIISVIQTIVSRQKNPLVHNVLQMLLSNLFGIDREDIQFFLIQCLLSSSNPKI